MSPELNAQLIRNNYKGMTNRIEVFAVASNQRQLAVDRHGSLHRIRQLPAMIAAQRGGQIGNFQSDVVGLKEVEEIFGFRFTFWGESCEHFGAGDD